MPKALAPTGDSDLEDVFLDRTAFRVNRLGGRRPKKRRRAGHRPIAQRADHQDPCRGDALGILARWRLSPGQAADLSQPAPLPEGIAAQSVAADKADDCDASIDTIVAGGARTVIPPRANRTARRAFDRLLDKGRHPVERFFCRRKLFRRIATRYHTRDARCEAFIALAAAWLWLA